MIESAVQFETSPGKDVVLRLDRQGVGGYLWVVDQVPAEVQVVKTTETDSAAAIGGGASLSYAVAARVPGIYRLVLELRRPWGDCDIAERRVITLVVKPD